MHQHTDKLVSIRTAVPPCRTLRCSQLTLLGRRYNLSQLRQCFKALALSVPSNTSVRMDGADLLSLQTAHCGRDGSVMAFIEYIFCPTSGSDATMD